MIFISYLINRFSDNLNKLSHAEKHIFYYIESNLEKAKNLSLTAMAEENNVSTTTIVRMCNKLGISAFSELKYILKNIDETSIPEDNFINNINSSISETLSSLNLESVNTLAKTIKASKQVFIIGVGLSKPIAEYFSKLLMQSNKISFYIYESHIIDLLNQTASKEDLIIFISNSGETKTLIDVAEKLSYRNFLTSAIVNNPDSKLSKLVTIPISTYSKKVNLLGYDITPRSTLLLIIDIIFGVYNTIH